MSDAILHGRPSKGRGFSLSRWRNRLIASPGFQSWASRFPLTRGIARRDGEDLFDLVAGFVHSQVLFALVELRLLHMLTDRPSDRTPSLAAALQPRSRPHGNSAAAGAALGLRELADARAHTALRATGAALLGVPGLEEMILHHHVLLPRSRRSRRLPARRNRHRTGTQFWPYVFGAASVDDPDTADTYSNLMADSQTLVAEETLRAVDLSEIHPSPGCRRWHRRVSGGGAERESAVFAPPCSTCPR